MEQNPSTSRCGGVFNKLFIRVCCVQVFGFNCFHFDVPILQG